MNRPIKTPKTVSPSSFSPFAKMKEIELGDCTWTTGFWAEKFRICERAMLPYMEKLLVGEVGHALNNFKIAAGLKEGTHQGMFWHDGDFYKWMEAALYVYAQNGDKALLSSLDEYIGIIGQAQEEDGYLQTQIQLRPQVDRYENRRYHEMYNSGHLLTAACIHYRVTGQDNFLAIAIKHADLLYTLFYPETKQFGRFGFNQTQIMGLVELYRVTEENRYLRLAERFINRRGKYPVEDHPTTQGYPIGDMVQERIPLRDAEEAAGHAVLALYFYAGAADVYAETGEEALLTALDRLWESVTQKKMYATGAVGQTHYGASSHRDKIEEGFIDDYMMPNMTAYNETCANICNAMFSYRMLGLKGESKYGDVMELVLYNSALSGISLEGTSYFYANPLRMVHQTREYHSHENATETPEREPYLPCFCCPPNLVRTLAKLSKWAYSLTEEGLAVILYGASSLETQLGDGSTLKLKQDTHYPWEGEVKILVEAVKSEPFEMLLRVPNWAEQTQISVNGEPLPTPIEPGKFARIYRSWRPGDVIQIDMPMEIQWIEGHPRIEELRNQLALRRGPLVYCIESPDLPEEVGILDVYVNPYEKFVPKFEPTLLGGICAIEGEVLIRKDQGEGMYRRVSKPRWESYPTRFIPYYSWSNRGLAEMTVFMPVLWGNE